LNHSLLLSTYYFISISCTIPNDLKFFKHVANLLWRLNPKKHHHFGHFFIQVDLVKYNCHVFCKAKKRIFANSNTYVLQRYTVEISKFFSTSSQTSVLQDHVVTCVQNVFFLKFDTCTRNGSFRALLVKT